MVIDGGVYMWTRKELKSEAKKFLKRNYWKAFIVCLITALLSGGISNSSTNSSIDNENEEPFFQQEYHNIKISPSMDLISSLDKGLENPFVFKVTSKAFILLIIIGLILRIVVGNVLEVGQKRFFIDGFKGCPEIGKLFTTFKNGEWLPITGKMLLMNIYLLLWTLLLVIPGIIKGYEYRMVPYILSENPYISLSDAIQISKEMTNDEKWEIFILDLSFLGWLLLGSLLFGIGGIFVLPYKEATIAKLYEHYRENIPLEEQFNYILD